MKGLMTNALLHYPSIKRTPSQTCESVFLIIQVISITMKIHVGFCRELPVHRPFIIFRFRISRRKEIAIGGNTEAMKFGVVSLPPNV